MIGERRWLTRICVDDAVCESTSRVSACDTFNLFSLRIFLVYTVFSFVVFWIWSKVTITTKATDFLTWNCERFRKARINRMKEREESSCTRSPTTRRLNQWWRIPVVVCENIRQNVIKPTTCSLCSCRNQQNLRSNWKSFFIFFFFACEHRFESGRETILTANRWRIESCSRVETSTSNRSTKNNGLNVKLCKVFHLLHPVLWLSCDALSCPIAFAAGENLIHFSVHRGRTHTHYVKVNDLVSWRWLWNVIWAYPKWRWRNQVMTTKKWKIGVNRSTIDWTSGSNVARGKMTKKIQRSDSTRINFSILWQSKVFHCCI